MMLIEGKFCLNCNDIQSSEEEISRIVTFVPQTSFLFSGTIRENIQTGKKDATDDEIWEVLDLAQMGDFSGISGRAGHLYRSKRRQLVRRGRNKDFNCPRSHSRIRFLRFDDCFPLWIIQPKGKSAKPFRVADRGVLVIAQRVATVRHADEIFVLDKGRILDRGTHEELEKYSEVYKEILASQLKSQEGEIR